MTDQPPANPAAARRFIVRLLIVDAICIPIVIAAMYGYSRDHAGWLLWVAIASGVAMSLALFWLLRDFKRSQLR